MPMSSKFPTESTGEKIVKIGEYLAKIWTKYDSLLFFGPPCRLQRSLGHVCRVVAPTVLIQRRRSQKTRTWILEEGLAQWRLDRTKVPQRGPESVHKWV